MPNTIDQLTKSFIEGLTDKLQTLEAASSALRAGDGESRATIRRLAHNLRGSGATYGFPEVSTQAASLEEATESGTPADVTTHVEQLSSTLREIKSKPEALPTRVLIIEADPGMSEALEKALSGADRAIFTVTNQADARTVLDGSEVHLIVMNLILPDSDGRSFLAHLRSAPQSAGAPVIVLSEVEDPATRSQCLALGADSYFTRPFDCEEIAATVSARLDARFRDTQGPHRDPLTGLLNRAGFSERFDQTMALIRRTELPACIALIDFDHFSTVNREHGRTAGDVILRQTADFFSKTVRKSDLLARWGGEEFVLLLTGTREEMARLAVERLLRSFRKLPLKLPEGGGVHMTFSAGVAQVRNIATAEEAVARADWFLFHAKTDGRDRVITASDRVASSRRRILVAEDDHDLARVLAKYLEEDGFDVVLCHNGDDAYAAAHKHQPDLALLDVKMPGMDGMELLGRMRKSQTNEKLPIIMVTSVGDKESILNAFEEGADDYVVKPFEPAELRARVRRLIRAADRQA